jgi:hypothetical protein
MPSLIITDAGQAEIRYAACEYLEGISRDLCELAYKNGFDSLTVIFEMAREEAERLRLASDEHLNRP